MDWVVYKRESLNAEIVVLYIFTFCGLPKHAVTVLNSMEKWCLLWALGGESEGQARDGIQLLRLMGKASLKLVENQ